jgi:hypothetical protein
MKNVTTQSIEDLLQDAGFDFAVIDRCPDSSCELCSNDEMSVAA